MAEEYMSEIYHVFNKSIAGFRIFNNDAEYARMTETIRHYQIHKPIQRFSQFSALEDYKLGATTPVTPNAKRLVNIIAYCLMPTPVHFVLEQLTERGIAIFISNVLNSHTRFFNTKHKRKGPLWQSRSKKVLIKTDEQLIHLTRYIHLNPVTAKLVDAPEDWSASSYDEYCFEKVGNGICQFKHVLGIEPLSYQKFVKDQIGDQRELAIIKKMLFD